MLKLSELDSLFPNEEACKEFLYAQRWPQGKVQCPRCQSEKVYKLSRAWHWQGQQCAKQGYRFSLLSGTVFENTKYPLKTWFTVALLMLHAKGHECAANQAQRLPRYGELRNRLVDVPADSHGDE